MQIDLLVLIDADVFLKVLNRIEAELPRPDDEVHLVGQEACLVRRTPQIHVLHS